jgi:hypothetical protein
MPGSLHRKKAWNRSPTALWGVSSDHQKINCEKRASPGFNPFFRILLVLLR